MLVLVSACLLGENCKYNGGNNRSAKVLDYLDRTGAEVIAVCPELLGGLPCPRPPAELVDGVVCTADGTSVDAAFRQGAAQALALLDEGRDRPDLCILQPRSPSCGVHEVYDGHFSGQRIPGSGLFAAALQKAGLRVVEPDELPTALL